MTIIDNLEQVLVARTIPSITLWNRLEARPRADRFDRALKAEVRDALWMTTRQWQMGELRGDDAASPIEVKIQVAQSRIRKYRPDGFAVEEFDDATPLEANVERRALPLKHGDRPISLDVRLLLGRQWLKMIGASAATRSEFIGRYPIAPPDPNDLRDALYCAHPEVWSSFAAFAGRAMDGFKLIEHLADPAHSAADGIPSLSGSPLDLAAIARRFQEWFASLIDQPESEDAWLPERLEYQFACSAPEGAAEKVYLAEEYFHGHLDWYNLDIDPAAAVLGDPVPPAPMPPLTGVVLPTPVTFDGMPNTRWWTFEDSRTNFGDIKPDTTDLAKLLLIEFGLTCANDWFLVPYTVPSGSVVRIKGMAVTDVFGDRTWVEAAGRGRDDDWQRWAMFLNSIKGENGLQVADTSLLLLPTAPAVQEGRVLEEVMLVRDEVANMVWGVESTIPLPTGEPKPGAEAARETRVFFERRAVPVPPPPLIENEARIRYDAMSSVPENWIPFIPVHVPGSNRETQLQRAAMLRLVEGLPEVKVRPRTSLLREGLDIPAPIPYFLHEEEVLRAGVLVTQRYQRTRWRDGRVWVWLGVRKQTGRGEATSGLAFDRILDVQPSA